MTPIFTSPQPSAKGPLADSNYSFAQHSPHSHSKYRQTKGAELLFLAALVGVIFAAYSNILFNFFLGDDFGLLIWIKGAMRYPEVLFRDFTGPWLASVTTHHYRPLISVTVLIDHLIYGFDATGFHVTNVIWLVVSAICLYFIVGSLLGKQKTPAPLWPCFAALLFGLYPLHSECISWIIARVDTVCTALFLASMVAYIHWRKSGRSVWLFASLGCTTLSLLSKEMAIIIPATLAAYEFCIISASERKSRLIERLGSAAKKTGAFWVLLVFYFVVRRLALGTFIGSYDDSASITTDMSAFVHKWVQGLQNLIVIPSNREIMGTRSPIVLTWELVLAPCAVLLLCSLRDPVIRRAVTFCALWFVLTLAPVYRLFAITDILQNSRYGYLATAPVCAMLTIGLAFAIQWLLRKAAVISNTPGNASVRTLLAGGLGLACMVSVVFFTDSFLMLRGNNSAWALAGRTANAIAAQLNNFYNTVPGDPTVLLVNLPDNIHGCYVCRNALDGLTQTPIISRDVHNCSLVNDYDRLVPFGYLKTSLPAFSNKLNVLAWNQTKRRLRSVSVAKFAGSDENANLSRSFVLSGADFHETVLPQHNSCVLTARNDGLEVRATKNKRAEVEIDLAQAIECFPADFIEIDLKTDPDQANHPVDIEFVNEIVERFQANEFVRAFLPAPDAKGCQTAIFSMRSHPSWVFGGRATKLMLSLPERCTTKLIAIRALSASSVMPIVSFKNSDWSGTKGTIDLSKTSKPIELHFDASAMRGAAAVQLEVSKMNYPFEWANGTMETGRILQKQNDVVGDFVLRRSDFGATGSYEIRCHALDKAGKEIGASGDHILVSCLD